MLPYGAWIRLFRAHGFVIEDLIELRPGPGGDQQLPRRRRPGVVPALAGGTDLEGAQVLVAEGA